MFCMECGSKLNEQAKFCHSCGSKIQPIMEIKDIPLEDGEKDNVFVDNIENADENQDFDSIEDVDENEDFELEIKEQIQVRFLRLILP